MAYEIINTKRSRSIIRITGNTATNIALSSLATDANEVITAASIAHIITSTDGWIRIYRGDSPSGNLIVAMYQSNDLPLTQYDISLANTPTANLHITNSGADGTVILSVTKTATYATPLVGI
jgi:hypothetical protein